MDRYPHVVAWAREQPWAILPSYLAIIIDLLRFRNAGGRLTPEEIKARIGTKPPRASQRYYNPETDEFYAPAFDNEGEFLGYRSETTGRALGPKDSIVSVLSVLGVIMQRPPQDISGPGGTAIERLTARYRADLNDPRVRAIVFDVDSPGGGVYGVQELANEIRASRGTKPTAAVANSLAASAAYWLASSAGELVVTPSGEVGSVGVYAAHEDLSGLLEQEGVKVTLLSYGKFKTEGNPFEALTAEARGHIQARVDDYGHAFERAVAKARGVSVDAVRSDFGQGRVYGAKEAVQRKMADRVDTLDNTVRRLAARPGAAPAPVQTPADATTSMEIAGSWDPEGRLERTSDGSVWDEDSQSWKPAAVDASTEAEARGEHEEAERALRERA